MIYGLLLSVKGQIYYRRVVRATLLSARVDLVYESISQHAEEDWFDIFYGFYYQIIVLFLMLTLVAIYRIKLPGMLTTPDHTDYAPAFKLTVYTLLFSMASVYALFYPLSFLLPEFVEFWLIEIPPIIYSHEGRFPVVPNILSILSLVVLAPVVEELVFRGLLLHRWIPKWGIRKAVIVSSLLFGIMHPDPIGGTVFGIAMSILYLRTHTLIIPILCHALNNLIALFFEIGYIVWLPADYVYTLEHFRSEWGIGLACGLVTVMWTYLYINSEKSTRQWRLPRI